MKNVLKTGLLAIGIAVSIASCIATDQKAEAPVTDSAAVTAAPADSAAAVTPDSSAAEAPADSAKAE